MASAQIQRDGAALSLALLGSISPVAIWLQREHKPAPEPGRIAIAVVPIAASPNNSWSSTAVQQALETELTSGDQLRVIAPSEVAQAMRDLHLAPFESLSSSARVRLGQLLGAQYLVEERTVATPDGNALQLESTLYRTATGEAVSAQHVAGSSNLEETTHELAVDIARVLPLRRALTLSPSLLPRSRAAVQSYSEGLAHLQALEPIAARDLFAQAAAVEPRSPVVHAALARTWSMLGYRPKAIAEAETAMSLDSGLPLRTKLILEAEADEIRRQWPAAIAAYSKLRDFDPDEVEHVLGLARCQLAAGNGNQALDTLHRAEQMPALIGADPRMQLLASTVEESLGQHAAALRDAEVVLTAAHQRGATQLMAQAQGARATALESLGKVDLAMQASQEAQRLFAQAGDIEDEAINLVGTGNLLEDHARYDEAKTCYLKARTIFSETGDEAHAALAENDLGIVADDVGDPQEALAHYTRSLETLQRVGDKQRIPLELNNIGIVQKELSQPDAAKRSFQQALHLLDQLHDKRRVAQEYNNLGFLSIAQGELDEAEHEFQQAFQIYSSFGQVAGTIYSVSGLAHVAWNRGQLDEAHARYQEAIRIARQIPEVKQVAIALRSDAHVLHDRGDEESARKELAQSLAAREAHHEIVAAAETKLSAIYFDLDNGQSRTSDSQFGELLTVFLSKKVNEDAVDTHLAWVTSLLFQRRTKEAVQHLNAAKILMGGLRNPDLKSHYALAEARMKAQLGNAPAAEATLAKLLADARQRSDLPAQMNLRLVSEQIRVAAGQGPDRFLRQHESDARSHKFLRVANCLKALQPHPTN